MTLRREIVVLLCFVIFASCQEVILDEQCETYFLKSYCAKVTQINCTTLEGEFKLDGKVVGTETIDITNIIGKGAMVMYTYAPSGIGGVSASWSVGNVTLNQASFWFTEIRPGVAASRFPTQVPRYCEQYCPKDCSGNGVCKDAFCECRSEYIGYACDIFVDDGCFADTNDIRNTLCVLDPHLEECTLVNFDVRVGDKTYPWVVNSRNPLTEEATNQLSLTTENGCVIEFNIWAFVVEEDLTIKGLVTVQNSCLGPEQYPIKPFTLKKNNNCPADYCSYSTIDARIFPEPTDVLLSNNDDVYYTMEQFSENPIIDLSLDVLVSKGTVEAYYNPLCRPNADNAQGSGTFSTPSSEWVIIPRDECSQRVLSPTHAMYYYFRFLCVSEDGCQFSLSVNYHNVDELTVKSEAAVVPKYKPIFSKPFYQYYQVVTPRDPFQLKLEVNYNDHSNVFGSLYVLPSNCASKENNVLSTSQRVSSNLTPEGRVVDVYTLDVPLDSTLNITTGRYLEITLDFTTVSGEFPIGYYSLVAIYPTDIPSLPSVPEPTQNTYYTPPDVTLNTPVDPETTVDETSGSSETSDTESGGNSDSDDTSGDPDDNGSNNAGLYVGLTIGALLLVAIVLAVGLAVGYVFYRRSKKSRYPLSIDDDGLLLSDEGGVDFDL